MGAERLGSVFWLAFGIYAIYGSVRLDLGTVHEPGTGFFPFVTGCFFSLMAAVVLFRSFLRGRGSQDKISAFWKGLAWHRPFAVGLIMLGYILSLERLGFLLTSLALLLLMLKWLEKMPWWQALLLSATASACTFLLFHTLLKATLPTGPLGF